jgi:predicted ATP-grasp superfamily ATP-dependent carboligase
VSPLAQEQTVTTRTSAFGTQLIQPDTQVPQDTPVIETSRDSNHQRAEPGSPPAVIAGAFQTGVLAVRTLTRRGVEAHSFDCRPDHPGFRSVHGRSHLCPNPDTDSDAWLEFMIELAGIIGRKAVLIPSSDQFVSAIARHATALAEHYTLSPGALLQGELADKQTQYDLASRFGMPMPRTRFATSVDEVAAFAREASFPCLLKPTHFREWKRFRAGHPLLDTKVATADSASALLENYRLAREVTPNVILQEIIQGPDTAKRVYLSCYNARGERIARAMFRELRCDPVGFGPASVSEPVVDDEADEICDRFLRAIGYVGICEIEVKRDTRDGRVKLIEVNPRLSGGGDAAPYAGVDLCWLHYLDLVGTPVNPVGPRDRHFKHVVLRADARAALAYWHTGLISIGDILRSYRPPLAFYDLDLRDWRYSAETLYVSARAFFQEAVALMKRGSR